ncbi:MAG TPA: potassium transporter KefB [Caldithrix abyssi]|uniref:Potassium transporter KefB n=1 Tax=Caldithrix abyssi TaxID=187145 RepID=A0A7V4WUD0_CALAY|nr:potassium transporter KefB [Caldithrix abyssi]
MGTYLLQDIVVIFVISIGVLFLFHKMHLPAILGFFLTGFLTGPYGLGLIKAVHEVEILAETGVVLLLFAIGIEFSFKRLLQIKKTVLLGGSLQVLLTLSAVFLILIQKGFVFGEAIFMGFLVSLSSTAIVLNIIQARAEIESPHGRTSLAILIFQDVIIIPMMLLTPFLTKSGNASMESLLFLLLKGVAIVLLVIISAKWIVPKALYHITRTRSRELFLLSVLVICMIIVWLTASAGLSLALGAFLAGLIISESEYSHQALGTILPFRDVFMSFFFVSVGMLLDIGFFLRQPFLILLIAACVLLLKTFISGMVTLFIGFPLRTGIIVGLTLCQVGEFSFILSKAGIEHGLLSGDIYQIFLSVSVLTMAVTPFIIAQAPRIAAQLDRLPLPKRLKSGRTSHSAADSEGAFASLKDHLVIIGFGTNGRNLARTAREATIPYVIIEYNSETVLKERKKGEPIFYGDASNEAVLRHARINEARIVVIAISDPTATKRITQIARQMNSALYIIVRTRFLQDMETFYRLGADEVIPEEFETSLEIFTRVLTKYLVPKEEIEHFLNVIRAENYRMLRQVPLRHTSVSDLGPYLLDVEINSLRVNKGSSLTGKTLGNTDFRKRFSLTVIAIRRNGATLTNPSPDTAIRENDILVVLGTLADIKELKKACG